MKHAIFHLAAPQGIRGLPDEIVRAIGEAVLKLQHNAI